MLKHPGIYIHFPWCVRKCPYCDFNSHPFKPEHDRTAYVESLRHDLSDQCERWQPPPFATAFLGGGTPSLFDAGHMAPLIAQLPMQPDAEITMEANPGATEYGALADYRGIGINRLSLGAQSFDDRQLQKLGRIHCAAETEAAFRAAMDAGFDNINIDLMWGLPGQSVEQAAADLQRAIDLGPQHISWYQLTIEPRTEFARRPPLLPVEEAISGIEQTGLAMLADAGYVRYEVSAFARDDKVCRHNLNYWRFGDYVGIGAGAHGKLTGAGGPVRTHHARQPRLYMGAGQVLQTDAILPQDLLLEFMMNALRLVDGVSFSTLTEHTGVDVAVIEPVWSGLVEQGLVRSDRCATTALGLRYLDSVVAAFIA